MRGHEEHMTRGMVLGLWMGLAALSVATLAPAEVRAEVDGREMQAREAFAAGRYQEALDLFVKLYAQKLHPNYLRNIGSCYQNLGAPDKAISSFREYLRKAKAVRADERAEVEGYIKEMEDLKKQREAAAATPPPSATPPPPVPGPIEPVTPPRLATAPAGTTPVPALTLTEPPPGSLPPVEESPPVYKRWWFWTLIGAVAVGAGLGVAAAAGAFTKTKDAPCTAGVTCGG